MDLADRIFEALRRELQVELEGGILPYWMTQVPDERNGGFHGRIDASNRVHPDAPRGGILNARILWTFSAAYRVLGHPGYLAMADRAYDYFVRHFIDPEHGGVLWSVSAAGQPLDTKKHTYTQAFGIYALSEYVRAKPFGGQRDTNEALTVAARLFSTLQRAALDRTNGGYREAFDRAWNPLDDVRLGSGDAPVQKSFNTHLHLLEAFTNLLRVWPDPDLAAQLESLVELHLRTIYDADTRHFHPFFEADWSVRATPHSFGHDIEAAWLLSDAVQVLSVWEDSGNAPIAPTASRTSAMASLKASVDALVVDVADVTIAEGVDAVHHGLFYLGRGMPGTNGSGPRHVLVDSDKHWWVQAEALVGLLYAHQLNPKPIYGETATGIWRFIQEKIKVPGLGEWRFRVDREGIPYPEEDLVSVWKCPYHNSRAALVYIERLADAGGHGVEPGGEVAIQAARFRDHDA